MATRRLMIGILAFLFMSTPALADTYFGYGLGIAKSASGSSAETKTMVLGYREELMFGLQHQLEAGYFNDSAGGGRKSSGWFGYSLGVEVQASPLVLRSMIGPSLLTTTDSYLGGHMQFNHDLYVGIRDKKGHSIGVSYKHMSSAGIYLPNIGRDFILVQVAVPL